jgi:hypothetical protein
MSWLPEVVISTDVVLLLLSTALIGATALAVQNHLAAHLAAPARAEPARKGASAPAVGLSNEPGRKETATTGAEIAAHLLDELRERVQADLVIDPDDPDPHSTDPTLRRFLRTVGGHDVAHAAKRLLETARWRFEKKPWAWTCSFCERVPGHHTFRQFGIDKLCRPVVYSCLSQAATNRYTAECAVQHCVVSIEQAVRTMPEGEVCWSWMCDFSGFSLRAVDLSMCAGVIGVVGQHYPERLGLLLVVNTPRIFMPVWRGINLLLDPSTRQKVKLVSGREETRTILADVLPAEDADWVMAELTANLVRPLADSQLRFWLPPPADEPHDPRGTPKYVATYLGPEGATGSHHPSSHLPHPNIALDLKSREPTPLTVMTEDD